MTIFLGVVLSALIVATYDVVISEKWWRSVLIVILTIVVTGLMMLSYWDWRP